MNEVSDVQPSPGRRAPRPRHSDKVVQNYGSSALAFIKANEVNSTTDLETLISKKVN